MNELFHTLPFLKAARAGGLIMGLLLGNKLQLVGTGTGLSGWTVRQTLRLDYLESKPTSMALEDYEKMITIRIRSGFEDALNNDFGSHIAGVIRDCVTIETPIISIPLSAAETITSIDIGKVLKNGISTMPESLHESPSLIEDNIVAYAKFVHNKNHKHPQSAPAISGGYENAYDIYTHMNNANIEHEHQNTPVKPLKLSTIGKSSNTPFDNICNSIEFDENKLQNTNITYKNFIINALFNAFNGEIGKDRLQIFLDEIVNGDDIYDFVLPQDITTIKTNDFQGMIKLLPSLITIIEFQRLANHPHCNKSMN